MYPNIANEDLPSTRSKENLQRNAESRKEESFQAEQKKDFEKKVGFMPMYPVPNKGNQTTTVLGGWELGIPQISKNKDLVWELVTIME